MDRAAPTCRLRIGLFGRRLALDEETRRCLTSLGGTFSGGVASFPDGTDQVAVWEQCVVEVQQIVGDAV